MNLVVEEEAGSEALAVLQDQARHPHHQLESDPALCSAAHSLLPAAAVHHRLALPDPTAVAAAIAESLAQTHSRQYLQGLYPPLHQFQQFQRIEKDIIVVCGQKSFWSMTNAWSMTNT